MIGSQRKKINRKIKRGDIFRYGSRDYPHVFGLLVELEGTDEPVRHILKGTMVLVRLDCGTIQHPVTVQNTQDIRPGELEKLLSYGLLDPEKWILVEEAELVTRETVTSIRTIKFKINE